MIERLSKQVIKVLPIDLDVKNEAFEQHIVHKLVEARDSVPEDNGRMFIVFTNEDNSRTLLKVVSLLGLAERSDV